MWLQILSPHGSAVVSVNTREEPVRTDAKAPEVEDAVEILKGSVERVNDTANPGNRLGVLQKQSTEGACLRQRCLEQLTRALQYLTRGRGRQDQPRDSSSMDAEHRRSVQTRRRGLATDLVAEMNEIGCRCSHVKEPERRVCIA